MGSGTRLARRLGVAVVALSLLFGVVFTVDAMTRSGRSNADAIVPAGAPTATPQPTATVRATETAVPTETAEPQGTNNHGGSDTGHGNGGDD